MEEFTTTFPRKTKLRVIAKNFNRENSGGRNAEGVQTLTPAEWKSGGKKNSDPA